MTKLTKLLSTLNRALATGTGRPLVASLAAGALILGFLFVTVHNRRPSAYQSQQAGTWGRYRTVIETWIEKGPLVYGDLRLVAQPEKTWTADWGPMDPTKDYLYKSYPMGFLRPAYALQLVRHWLGGDYSQWLMVLHNQALVWLSSALLGLLAFVVARDHGLEPAAALALGFSCQAVFQTFPYNLQFYWEAYYTTVMSAVVAWYLLQLYRVLGGGPDAPRLPALAATAFLLFYVDYVGATFLGATVILTMALMDAPALRRLAPLRTVVAPGVLFYGLFWLEKWAVLRLHPGLAAAGSSVLARTGLDGSTAYYAGHIDLLRLGRDLFAMWGALFAPGVLAVGVLCVLSLRHARVRREVIVLVVALGLYVPKAFVLSQETAIHPYAYDVYLVLPLSLALLGFLPAWLESRFGRPGLFVLVAVALAFCYSFVQLRTYAVMHPVPPEVRWLRL